MVNLVRRKEQVKIMSDNESNESVEYKLVPHYIAVGEKEEIDIAASETQANALAKGGWVLHSVDAGIATWFRSFGAVEQEDLTCGTCLHANEACDFCPRLGVGIARITPACDDYER